MKKALAVLLSMSMVLAVCSCSKSEETKRTRRSTSSKEEQTEESSDEPSETSSDPTTESSEDPTTETSATPEIKPSENLHSQVELKTYGLAELINDDNFTRVDGITYEFNRIRFTTDQFPELRKEVDSFYDDLEAALTNRFEERKASGISSRNSKRKSVISTLTLKPGLQSVLMRGRPTAIIPIHITTTSAMQTHISTGTIRISSLI